MPPAPKALEMSDKLIDAQGGFPCFAKSDRRILANGHPLPLSADSM